MRGVSGVSGSGDLEGSAVGGDGSVGGIESSGLGAASCGGIQGSLWGAGCDDGSAGSLIGSGIEGALAVAVLCGLWA